MSEELEQLEEWEHLGDGLYAQFDGYQIWLGLPGPTGANYIQRMVALDPHVEKAFGRYVMRKNVALESLRLARKDAEEKRGG